MIFKPIGIIASPYKEKFAIPRQPGLVEDGVGELRLLAPYNQPESVRGLSDFSHVWLLFLFHQTMAQGWRPTVRPPRLGGNIRMGVFATRSTFRPNPIGMSLVALNNVRCSHNSVVLELGSIDLVDGTPIIDIKPYLPFAESKPYAKASFAQSAPETAIQVIFNTEAEISLERHQQNYPYLTRFITQVLAQDPRPAYRKSDQQIREYAMHLLEFNVRWRSIGHTAEVFAIDKI